MPTVLLLDDEPAARRSLRKLIAAFPELTILAEAGSVEEAKRFLADQRADLIFLDMEMPGGHGLELLPGLDPATAVVFVTASEAYAVKAFGVGAVDYLVKPIDPERLALAVERVLRALAPAALASAPTPESERDRPLALAVEKAGLTHLVPLEEILWIEAMQNYTCAYLKGRKEAQVFRFRMNEWEEELPPEKFQRLGRSLIVALPLIRSTEWRSRDETLVHFTGADTPTLSLSRITAAKLKEALRQR